jgi:hypothetical protein
VFEELSPTLFRYKDHIGDDSPRNYSIVACIFVAALTFILSCCLATIRGYIWREENIYEVFMKCAVEKGSGVMIYIPGLMKIGSAIQTFIGVGFID